MAYEGPRFPSGTGYGDDQAHAAAGLDGADDPDYGQGYPADGYDSSAAGGYDPSLGMGSARQRSAFGGDLAASSLDDDGREPGDRISVHLLWEGTLLLFAAVLLYLLHHSDPSALRGSALRELLLFVAVVGLVTTGAAFSLRAAVPNLALGPVVYASAMFFAARSDAGLTTTALFTALAAAGIGVAIAVITVGFHVPAWAASLGVGLAVMVWLERQDAVSVVNGAYEPQNHAWYWFIGFVLVSGCSGLFGLIRSIRRTVGGYRPTGDPARRRTAAGSTTGMLALIGSTVLASIAGVLLALGTRPLPTGENGLALSGLALGAALLGGTSVYGRRGGIFGTVLAVALLVLLCSYGEARDWSLSLLAIGAAAVVAGLVVTRLIETFGVSNSDDEDEASRSLGGWRSAGSSGEPADSWSSDSRSGGWTTQLSARTADDGWGDDDRWGAR